MNDKYKGRYKYKNTWDYAPKRYDAVRDVYKCQLKKFERLGLGGITEFGVVVTPKLIRLTQSRYEEVKKLTLVYNKKMISDAEKCVMSKRFIKKIEKAEAKELLDEIALEEKAKKKEAA